MLPAALLFFVPIVVVDVDGGRLDPSHTRELVSKELSVTAVAPDDPRAPQATGRIDVVTDAGKLTVRYRKVDGPVERTIALANDVGRAESDVAYLAGNLARDEASELVPAENKQKKNAAASQPIVAWQSDDRDLAQMRAFLTQSANEERSARHRGAVIRLAAGLAFLAPSTYFWFDSDASNEAKVFRLSGTLMGASLLMSAIGSAFVESGDLEGVSYLVEKHEKQKSDPGLAITEAEKEWAKRATSARTTRIGTGWFCVVLGGAAAALGSALMIADGPRGDAGSSGFALIGVGTLAALFGAAKLLDETGIESSYRLWRTVKTAPETGMRISFGGTPLPGGGAASFALTF
jgi:hypothetical protein